MANFKTRPNLSNLQFRQEQNTVLDLKGITKVLPNGQIRIVHDDISGEYGKLVLEGPDRSSEFGSGNMVVKARYNPGGEDDGVLYKEFIDFSGLTFTVYQENHGFHVGDVIGFEDEPPDGDGVGKYSKAIADGTYNGEPLGLASDIIDDDYFVLMQVGFTIFDENHPYFNNPDLLDLIPGKVYYLSAEDAGKMVINPPTQIGHIIKPVFLPVKDQNSGETNRGWVLPYPPTEIRGFLTPYLIEGDGVTRNFEINHGLNTTNLLVHSYRYHLPYSTIYLRTDRVDEDGIESNNNIMIKFTKPPPDGEKYKILVGA